MVNPSSSLSKSPKINQISAFSEGILMLQARQFFMIIDVKYDKLNLQDFNLIFSTIFSAFTCCLIAYRYQRYKTDFQNDVQHIYPLIRKKRKKMKLYICLLAILATTLTSIIPHCHVQNVVDKHCLVCEVGWKQIDGACETCDQGYQMVNNNCVLIYSTNIQSTTQGQTNSSQNSLPTTSMGSSGNTNTQGTATTQNYLTTSSGTQGSQTSQGTQTTSINQNVQMTQNTQTTSENKIPNIVSQTIPGFIVIQNPCTGVDSTGKCQGCISGYTLSNGACIQSSSSTSSSSAQTSSTSTSGQSSTSASTGQSSTSTTSGQSSTSIQTTNLTPSSILSSIMQSSSTTTVPSSVSVVNQNAASNGCSRYDNNTQACLQCAAFYHRDPSITTEVKCIQSNPRCKSYTSTYTCQSCYSGYTVFNGDCIMTVTQTATTTSDPNCKTPTDSSCEECYPGYYLDSSTLKCEVANPLCKEVNPDNTCKSCYGGYIRYLGQCIDPYSFNQGNSDWKIFYFSIPVSVTSSSTIGYSDPNCKTYKDGTCSQCADRSYLKDGVCYQVNPNCKLFNNQTGGCTDCYQGYALVGDSCSAASYSQSPQQCPYRSVLKNSQCVQVSGLCKSWDPVTGLCTKCYLGYSEENGICKRTI